LIHLLDDFFEAGGSIYLLSVALHLCQDQKTIPNISQIRVSVKSL